MVSATFESIAVSADGSSHLVLLKTVRQDIVPIAISPDQALSICVAKDPDKFDRPLTHDLLLSVIEMLCATIKHIEISDLNAGVFYGKLILENRGIEYDIDARPSDLLALAVRVDVPIFVAETVISEVALEDITEGIASVEA